MAKEEKKLEQTKGVFKVKGLVKNLDRDNAYEEGERVGGKNEGRTYRKLNMGVQTAEDNQIRLGMYAYEPEKVFLWNSEKRKKDSSYKGERMDYYEYLDKKEVLKANGTAVLQARVGTEYDDKGKLQSSGMTSFEATEEIYDNVDNDDSVYVEGQISYSTFKNKQDEEVTATNYNIERLFVAKDDFDLEDEDYEEQNYYEQEFVFVDAMVDKENEKVIVTGRIIDYHQNTIDTSFSINYADDEDMKKLAKNITKKFKFGDLVTVFGEILNQAVSTEVEEEDDDLLAGLGGKSQPKFATRTNVAYNREMTIDGVLKWEKQKYTPEDFEKNELVDESEDDDFADELGGKSKKKHKKSESFEDADDPFASGDSIDIDDDSLPF